MVDPKWSFFRSRILGETVFFLVFGDFGGQKSKNFDFFFWVPNGFLYGLGVVWGLSKWILDISGGLWGQLGQ